MPPNDPRLANARVHIGGAGRVGTAVALALQASGVGCVSCNDPQVFGEEQLPCYVFSRRSDVGRPKVHVLRDLFAGRPGFVFEPVVAPNESGQVIPYVEQADVVVCCANRLPARLHLERTAMALKKPSVQAGVQDGRRSLGGIISSWVPDADCCCFGCLFPNPNLRFARGERLVPTVTTAIGTIAAQRIIDLLVNRTPASAGRPNLLIIDLASYAIEKLSVKRREGCRYCGR
jgi:molybdopterin/thiamine biosynthesis adenylyltransferase